MSPQAPTNSRKCPPTGPGSTSLEPGPALTVPRKSNTQSAAAGASLVPAAGLPAAAAVAAAAGAAVVPGNVP